MDAASLVRGTPPGTIVHLLPEWCTPAEEAYLLGRASRAGEATRGGWTQLSGRRLQNHGGAPHEKGMIPTPMPDWLLPQIAKAQETCGALMPAAINHVLVNEYRPGEGIDAHRDGPLYHPAVCIVSLGCDCVMRFAPDPTTADPDADADAEAEAHHPAPFDVWLPRRSALLFAGDAYERFLHGIDAVDEHEAGPRCANGDALVAARAAEADDAPDDRGRRRLRVERKETRVSLTFRSVKRVRKALRLG